MLIRFEYKQKYDKMLIRSTYNWKSKHVVKIENGKIGRFCKLSASCIIINNAKLTELAKQLRKYLKERL